MGNSIERKGFNVGVRGDHKLLELRVYFANKTYVKNRVLNRDPFGFGFIMKGRHSRLKKISLGLSFIKTETPGLVERTLVR